MSRVSRALRVKLGFFALGAVLIVLVFAFRRESDHQTATSPKSAAGKSESPTNPVSLSVESRETRGVADPSPLRYTPEVGIREAFEMSRQQAGTLRYSGSAYGARFEPGSAAIAIPQRVEGQFSPAIAYRLEEVRVGGARFSANPRPSRPARLRITAFRMIGGSSKSGIRYGKMTSSRTSYSESFPKAGVRSS